MVLLSRHTGTWLFVLILFVGPLLSACMPTAPQPVQSGTTTNLVQVVESYMADLPGSTPKLFLTTRIYDRNGVPLGEFWDEGRRYWIPLQQVAEPMIAATIATEDKTFYSNPGVDWAAIARAAVQNASEGGVVSGASTITQQLARNITMPFERRIDQSLDRKLEETVIAQDLTQNFTKDEILEMYLNVVNFGHLAYGVEAAARTYFNKSAADLSLAESALLAALPQSPAYLDPLQPGGLERAKRRQQVVLGLMVRHQAITKDEAEAAYAEPLLLESALVPEAAPHFLIYLKQHLESMYGEQNIGRLGLTITSTLDLRVQHMAEAIVRQQVASLSEPYNLNNAALVAIKPGSGEIVAMVGSAGYENEEIDGQVNVATSLRQPGSAIKPILYAAAFSGGMGPADLLWDIPAQFPLDNLRVYRPTNYDAKFHGPVRVRQALANSYNVPAVKTLDRVGIPAMLTMAQAMGVKGLDRPASEYGLALTLGGAEVSLLSLTNAYATLANGGNYMPVTPVHQATDSAGRAAPALAAPPPQPVMDARVAYMVTSILADNEARTPAFGSSSPLLLSRPAAAKTGTTTDWRDNWTIGYTPYLAAGVWAGNTDGTPMRNTSGLTGAAPIWHDFFETLFATPELEQAIREPEDALEFVRPPGLVDMPICELSSLNFTDTCPNLRPELFIDPAIPIQLGRFAVSNAEGGATAPQPVSQTLTTTLPTDPAVVLSSETTVDGQPFCGPEYGGPPVLILRLPEDPQEARRARSWAGEAGLPVDASACGRAPSGTQAGAPAWAADPIAHVSWPQPYSAVRGPVHVTGSALFAPQAIQFFKVEYGYGSSPDNWITMGDVHTTPVADGWLETWHAESLPAGSYALRLVLVKPDGNYVATSPIPVEVVP